MPIEKASARFPVWLESRAGKGKISHANASHLMNLVLAELITEEELHGYVRSGLNPRTINSHVSDLRRERLTVQDLIRSGEQARENRIPDERKHRILNAKKGKFMLEILKLINDGYRPPYTFIWQTAKQRLMQTTPQGEWIYPKEFKEQFDRKYEDYYHNQRRRFSLQRQFDKAKEKGDLHLTEVLETTLHSLTKELKQKRRALGRIIAQM